MFSSRWLPELFGRAFAPVPDIPIYEWAESGPFLLRKSPEPTYRSSFSPWTRRGQDLLRKPWHNGRRIRRFGARKSSQSGYTEGVILNPVRWTALHRPRNCIISVDSQKEVDNLRSRLVPTLEDLGASLFTGDDDDLSKFTLRLAGMDIWFAGSFSPGGFSNKYAPWVFNDEIDLYGELSAEGDTIENFWSRAKTAEDGFQVVISKPASKDGPIDSFFGRGNQEFWNVPCPHHGCRERQTFEWERVKYDHCRELMGEWDLDRVLRETYYQCRKCGEPINEIHKGALNSEGVWIETEKGDPEIVTQHMSDLYSMHPGSTLGHLAKEWITATSKDSRELKQTFYQQRLGIGWEEQIKKIEEPDILKLRKPYRRGTIPHKNCVLAAGMDIGLYTNTRWVVYAFNCHGEMWLIDWGVATGPADIITLMRTKRYACAETGAMQQIQKAFIDARYRCDEVYDTCLLAPENIIPTMGMRNVIAARSISYKQVPNRPEGFFQINFVNRDAMFDLYVDRIKDGKPPGFHWPENVEEIVVREHCAERMIRHRRTNKVIWEDEHKRPNHFGDASKIVLTGVDWLITGKRSRILTELDATKVEDQEFDGSQASPNAA